MYSREVQIYVLSIDSLGGPGGTESPGREGDREKGHIPLVPGPRIQSPISPVEEQPTKAWDEHDVCEVEKNERVHEDMEMCSQVLQSEYIGYRARKVVKDMIVHLERGREIA